MCDASQHVVLTVADSECVSETALDTDSMYEERVVAVRPGIRLELLAISP